MIRLLVAFAALLCTATATPHKHEHRLEKLDKRLHKIEAKIYRKRLLALKKKRETRAARQADAKKGKKVGKECVDDCAGDWDTYDDEAEYMLGDWCHGMIYPSVIGQTGANYCGSCPEIPAICT